MKKVIFGIVTVMLLTACSVAFGEGAPSGPIFQNVHYVINSNAVESEGEYSTFNYDGHMYAPIRFIAEQVAASIKYDANTSTLTLNTVDPCEKIGPSVTPDQAKIVAYETYHLVHVDENTTIRALSELERKQIPPDQSDFTPVYYFITGTDKENKPVTICVSSNQKNHHFIYRSVP